MCFSVTEKTVVKPYFESSLLSLRIKIWWKNHLLSYNTENQIFDNSSKLVKIHETENALQDLGF